MRDKGKSGKAAKKVAGEGWAEEEEEEEEAMGAPDEDGDVPEISVSLFDYSVENHFRTMDTIAELCGEAESDFSEDSEVERLSSTITFLREWRHFNYKPRIVKFSNEVGSPQGSAVSSTVILPQFSSAAIPKKGQGGGALPVESSKDFVMHTGGPVWALDWCPRVREMSANDIKCEFIAVASHPPDSSYHKMGVSLVGRGVVQIWCVLNVLEDEDEVPFANEKLRIFRPKIQSKKPKIPSDKSDEPKKPKGRPRKYPISDDKPKRPKGRPKKTPTVESPDNVDCNNQLVVVQPMSGPLDICLDVAEMAPPQEGCMIEEVLKKKLPAQKKQIRRLKGGPVNESLDASNPIYQPIVLEPGIESSYVLVNETEMPPPTESPKQGPATKNKSSEPMKTRGRARKKPLDESVDHMVSNSQLTDPQTINNSSDVCINKTEAPPSTGSLEHDPVDKEEFLIDFIKSKKTRRIHKKKPINDSLGSVDGKDHHELLDPDYCVDADEEEDVVSVKCGKKRKSGSKTDLSSKKPRTTAGAQSLTNGVSLSEGKESSINNLQTNFASSKCLVACNLISNNSCLDISLVSSSIRKDAALPKLVLCLAHNGKVVWDVKWRPSYECDSESKQRMGYLAVLLGNGSLEVWEVPLPQTIKTIYSSTRREGTDPRFVKLKPVFRCSKLTSGGVQSIPLSVEWSSVPPHDVLLAGCHDGTVALWKFAASCVSEDTRPLLHFTADTSPIRAVMWAPTDSDHPESANVIATAGHGALKFWDIRDPYRPLWDLHQIPKIIYGMDWHLDTRSIILTFEDGGLRFFSLATTAYDIPVTGESFLATKQPGFHTYNYSSFALWHVHVSPVTGMVAYCGEDGIAACFQLTVKTTEKGSLRYRYPRFLCGSLTEEESAIIIHTSSPYTPMPLPPSQKTARNGSGDSLKLIEGPSSSQAKTSGTDQTFECEETEADGGIKKTPKSKGKKKAVEEEDDDQAFGDETGTDRRPEEGGTREFESFPAKAVAMHRVRWNVNKGSERWLCFGGAAGLVRCQEISKHYLDKKAYSKR